MIFMLQDEYTVDVLIIGAGLVGNSLALAIADKAQVAIIENNPLDLKLPSDERALALSFSTQRILTALNIWQIIQPHTTPIQQVHVSEAGRFGATRFIAADEGLDAFGHTITAQILTDTLRKTVLDKTHIQHFYGSSIQKITPIPDGYRVIVQTKEESIIFKTHLLVGADGAQSQTRKLLEISAKQEDYAQTAFVARVSLTRVHQHIAYERFSEHGVLAALPMKDDTAVIVWTVDTNEADVLKKLSDSEFCTAFQKLFGQRLGRLQPIGGRVSYPVRGLHALEQIRPHALLLGNAAHTLHPVAAQGFNLSLRDVVALVQIILDEVSSGEKLGQLWQLEKYLRDREVKQREMIIFTESLVRSFSKKTLGWRLLKNTGLLGLALLPFAKSMLARQGMGVAENLPRWVLDRDIIT